MSFSPLKGDADTTIKAVTAIAMTRVFLFYTIRQNIYILGNFHLKWHEKKKLIRGLKMVCRKFNKPFR